MLQIHRIPETDTLYGFDTFNTTLYKILLQKGEEV